MTASERAHRTGFSIAESAPGDYIAAAHPGPDAPNVVLIVLDDLGFGQLGCFGSDIATPAIDALAAGGLRYNHFHVTSLCSPTRACLMTGRNHHAVGMGFLTDLPMAFPGYTGRIPRSATPLPRVLRDAGYNTLAIGKWHLVPGGERSVAGPYDRWPLGFGFERYYGFLQGDTNHWAPHLVRDNHYVEQPNACTSRMATTSPRTSPTTPSALDHRAAPRHARPPHLPLLRTRGDARAAPRGTRVGRAVPGCVRPRMGAVARRRVRASTRDRCRSRRHCAERTTELDRRVVVAVARCPAHAGAPAGGVRRVPLAHRRADRPRGRAARRARRARQHAHHAHLRDNGASGEGGALRARSTSTASPEHVPDTVENGQPRLERRELGGLRSYPHYSWGWAWAGNTPLRLWKRYTWLGGTRTPLVAHWPRGIEGSGAVRDQFVHAVDLMPTVLDAAGIPTPDAVDGVEQQPIDGASIRATFSDATAPSPRSEQYFEMLGSRSMVAGRAGRRRPITCRRAWSTRSASSRAATSSSATTVALFRLLDDFAETRRRRCSTIRRRARRPAGRSGTRRRRAQSGCSRSSTSSSVASPQ